MSAALSAALETRLHRKGPTLRQAAAESLMAQKAPGDFAAGALVALDLAAGPAALWIELEVHELSDVINPLGWEEGAVDSMVEILRACGCPGIHVSITPESPRAAMAACGSLLVSAAEAEDRAAFERGAACAASWILGRIADPPLSRGGA